MDESDNQYHGVLNIHCGANVPSGILFPNAEAVNLFGDVDSDGICPSVDNCVNISNPLQANLDGDGLGDACDNDNVITTSIVVSNDHTLISGITITGNNLLTIPSGFLITIPSEFGLDVSSGSGVMINPGGGISVAGS